MKPLIPMLCAAFLAVALASCAQNPAPTVASYPYARYSTGYDVIGPADSPYRSWTTAQLQQRRLDLYGMVPQGQTRNGIAYYISHGPQTPQQDEIRAIEGELNRRYKQGDRAAELKPAWPEVRRHPA